MSHYHHEYLTHGYGHGAGRGGGVRIENVDGGVAKRQGSSSSSSSSGAGVSVSAGVGVGVGLAVVAVALAVLAMVVHRRSTASAVGSSINSTRSVDNSDICTAGGELHFHTCKQPPVSFTSTEGVCLTAAGTLAGKCTNLERDASVVAHL